MSELIKRLIKGNLKLFFAEDGPVDLESDEEVEPGFYHCVEHIGLTYDEIPDNCQNCYSVMYEPHDYCLYCEYY